MNDELDRMRKEAVVAYLGVLLGPSPARTENHNKDSHSGQ
jgi:hypothetical protein